jgi:hypothetical protein
MMIYIKIIKSRHCQYPQCVASSGRVVYEWWIVKDSEGTNRRLINIPVLFRHFPGETQKNYLDLDRDTRCPSHHAKWAPPANKP